ncbi:hypothetical protein TREES_T100016704 [Tupaia chinensis]|uniref:Uncharacterized protein n=1 Tax=Tupaia chinensis TaxID=246437 RepID=L9L6G8_TUPCH|nr:hypothetical protein TREES_T100016704 [Tupaia chinensis]
MVKHLASGAGPEGSDGAIDHVIPPGDTSLWEDQTRKLHPPELSKFCGSGRQMVKHLASGAGPEGSDGAIDHVIPPGDTLLWEDQTRKLHPPELSKITSLLERPQPNIEESKELEQEMFPYRSGGEKFQVKTSLTTNNIPFVYAAPFLVHRRAFDSAGKGVGCEEAKASDYELWPTAGPARSCHVLTLCQSRGTVRSHTAVAREGPILQQCLVCTGSVYPMEDFGPSLKLPRLEFAF